MNRQAQQQGFTLVELILVITIIAITAGAVTLGVRGQDESQRMRAELQLLADRFEAAQIRSQAIGREIGFFKEQDNYYFAVLDYWNELDSGQFEPVWLPAERQWQLGKAFDIELDSQGSFEVLIQPDGLYQPDFTIQGRDEGIVWMELVADGLNRPRLREVARD